jgi:hypothetical protein
MILRRFMSLGLLRLVTGWACVLAVLAGCAGPTIAPPVYDGNAPGSVGVVVPDTRPVDPARAQNVFVMLSGGVNPSSNNYSQYLQAKAVTTFWERNYPLDTVWTFFGAGNVEGQPPLLGDVRRTQERDGRTVNTWLPGAISRNRPAKREVILSAFREEILPRVRDGGTVYLFVGDHGSQRGTGDRESIIDLWTLARDATSERGWKTERGEVLGVSDLRKVLAECRRLFRRPADLERRERERRHVRRHREAPVVGRLRVRRAPLCRGERRARGAAAGGRAARAHGRGLRAERCVAGVRARGGPRRGRLPQRARRGPRGPRGRLPRAAL